MGGIDLFEKDIKMTTESSPRKIKWFDHIFININWFSLTLRTQVLAGLLIPVFVLGFVGEAQKGSYYGAIRLWALMVAVLAQGLFGLLSDRSRLKWGRRRPFIFIGTVLEVLIIISMIWISGLQGTTGFAVLLIAYIFSMLLSNMSQAGTQGLIPDLVLQEGRGISSGVKTLLEVPLPLVVIGLAVAPMVSKGNIPEAIFATVAVMLICMGLTMFAKEEELQSTPEELNWKPFTSLLMMTVVFTIIILGLGQVVKFSIATFDDASNLVYGTIGVIAMLLAVVVGVFASLSVHIDKTIRNNKPFTWLIISRLAAFVAINNIAAFLLYFFQEKFDMPTSEAIELAGLLPMVLGGFVILFGLIAGWLSDRYDRKLLTIISGLIGALGVGVIVLGTNIAMMYVAAAIVGLAYALFNVASWALSTDIVPEERAGEFLGIQNLAGAGAGAIGAYIGGTVADHAGYVLMMAMFGVMFLLAGIAAVFISNSQRSK
jgi:MFS family permease